MCAISPQRQSKLSKRISAQSKMSIERGKICIGHMKPRVRLTTQLIGLYILTSTKIGADAVLVSESDSESFGAWQQKPIFLLRGSLHRTYVRSVRTIARAHFVKKITRLYANKYKEGVDFPISICYTYIVKREIEVGGWFSKKILRKVEITS